MENTNTVYDFEKYPYNLVAHILADRPDSLPSDIEGSVEYLLHTLDDPRSVDVFHLWYREGLSQTDIGKHLDISHERVRQVIARDIRNMRHPERIKYLKLGVSSIVREAEAVTSKYQQFSADMLISPAERQESAFLLNGKPDLPLERLGLSSRSYNALKRRQLHTVKEVLRLSHQEFFTIRNLGDKSCLEVIRILNAMGYNTSRLTDGEDNEFISGVLAAGRTSPQGENPIVLGIIKIVEELLRQHHIQIPDDLREDCTDPIVGCTFAELHDNIRDYLVDTAKL